MIARSWQAEATRQQHPGWVRTSGRRKVRTEEAGMAAVEIRQVSMRGERRTFLTFPWRDSVIGFFECVEDDAVAAALFDYSDNNRPIF